MTFLLGKIVIDCGQGDCKQLPWQDPTTVTNIEVPFWQSLWMLIICSLLLGALILATSIVRYRRYVERGQTDRRRIDNPPKQCPTCGDTVEA
jgi:hypothetical protein